MLWIYAAAAGMVVLILLLALLLLKISEIKEARNNKKQAEADRTDLKKEKKSDKQKRTADKKETVKKGSRPDNAAAAKSDIDVNKKRKEIKIRMSNLSAGKRSSDGDSNNKSVDKEKRAKGSDGRTQNNIEEEKETNEKIKNSPDNSPDINRNITEGLPADKDEKSNAENEAEEETVYRLLPARSFIISSPLYLGHEQELARICKMLLPESAVAVEGSDAEEDNHAAKEAFVKAFLAKADAEADNLFTDEDDNSSDAEMSEGEETGNYPTNILISGLPGSGKTELAARIAERARKWGWTVCYFVFHESFARTCTDSVLDEWLSLRQKNSAKDGGGNECTLEEMYRHIIRIWQTDMPERTLLIFDDVDNFEGIEELLQLPFRFVFTADSLDEVPDIPGIYKHQLQLLDEWYSMRLCEIYYHGSNQGRFSAYNRSCMTAIIYLANGHPLTLELLSRTCSNANINPHTLLNTLRDKGFNLREDSRKMDREEFRHQMSLLYEITNISQMRGAEELLLQMSVLNTERCRINDYISLLEMEDESQIKKLSALGWLRLDSDESGNETAAMNSALQHIIRDCLHPQSEDVREMSVRVIAGMDPVNKGTDSPIALMLRQAESILRNCSGSSSVMADMAYRAAELRYVQGDFERAFVLFRKALLFRNNVFGEYHADTANCYERLGDLYQRQGYLDEAIIMFRKVIKIRNEAGWNDIQSKILTYKNTIALLETKKDHRAALETDLQLMDALEKEDKSSEDINREYADTMVQIVRLYIKLDDRINALDWRNRAFERLGADSGRDELYLIDSFFGDNIEKLAVKTGGVQDNKQNNPSDDIMEIKDQFNNNDLTAANERKAENADSRSAEDDTAAGSAAVDVSAEKSDNEMKAE